MCAAAKTKQRLAAAIGYRQEADAGHAGVRNVDGGAWTDECTRIMQTTPKYLIDFDQLREGARLCQGDERYARNPLVVQCMLDNGKCCGHRHLGKMSYPQDVWNHCESSVHKVQ